MGPGNFKSSAGFLQCRPLGFNIFGRWQGGGAGLGQGSLGGGVDPGNFGNNSRGFVRRRNFQGQRRMFGFKISCRVLKQDAVLADAAQFIGIRRPMTGQKRLELALLFVLTGFGLGQARGRR